jgi:hypothetical protein
VGAKILVPGFEWKVFVELKIAVELSPRFNYPFYAAHFL